MFLPSPVSTFPSVGRVLGHCIQSFLYKMADVSKEDRQYLEAIQARMKQQAAQRAAKEASLGNANEHAQSGLSATALGKRPAILGNNPVETFSLEQYNELAHQVTKLKSEHGVKELEWQRKLIELRKYERCCGQCGHFSADSAIREAGRNYGYHCGSNDFH